MKEALRVTEAGSQVINMIHHQVKFVERLREIHTHSVFSEIAAKLKSTKDKTAMLKESLGARGIFSGLREIDVVSPLDASIRLVGVIPDSARFFSSATCPMDLEFRIKPTSDFLKPSNVDSSVGGVGGVSSVEGDNNKESKRDERSERRTENSSDESRIRRTSKTSMSLAPVHSMFADIKQGMPKRHFVYKTGTPKEPEDMRQDQLVVQLFDLCDRLFKTQGMDLCLTPYKIVPLSRNDGLMEFLNDAVTITNIQDAYKRREDSILSFLRDNSNNSHPHAKYGIDPEVIETFIRSCAGYCVITYVLAIGDRHLENLMVKPSGHLLHIDFGYIFGRNPLQKKLLGTPMRLIWEMVVVMGGRDSEDYQQFKRYCCQAYLILRKNATLLCNILELMSEAGINDLSVHQDSLTVITKVRERLCMDKTDDEEAQAFLQAKLKESAGALSAVVMDRLHNISTWVQYGGVA